jgi:hypothetical protein
MCLTKTTGQNLSVSEFGAEKALGVVRPGHRYEEQSRRDTSLGCPFWDEESPFIRGSKNLKITLTSFGDMDHRSMLTSLSPSHNVIQMSEPAYHKSMLSIFSKNTHANATSEIEFDC